MFSFTKGRPIAVVNGGKYNKKILHLIEEPESIKSLKELENDEFFKCKRKRYTLKELSELRKAKGETDDLNKDLIKIYTDARKDFQITDGKLEPLPSNLPERIFIAGASGSGKSTFAGNYMKRYKQKFKKNEMFVFSRNTEDSALDKAKPIRVELSEELIEEPLDMTELSKSLVVFDDITTIPDKAIREEVLRLREDLLECGRKEEIYVLVTNHNLLDYKNTRNLLNEASSVVFFPKGGGGQHQIQGFLTRHAGLGKNEIQKIRNLPSRWVSIYRTYPTFILHERGAYIL